MITPGDWAEFATAVGTLALAGAAFRSIKESNEQRDVSAAATVAAEKSADASERAAAAAAGATKEAARSRADQWAPLVVVLPGQPHWPPRISRSIHSMPGAKDTRLLDTKS